MTPQIIALAWTSSQNLYIQLLIWHLHLECLIGISNLTWPKQLFVSDLAGLPQPHLFFLLLRPQILEPCLAPLFPHTLHSINQQICQLHPQNISRSQPPLIFCLVQAIWYNSLYLASLPPLVSVQSILHPVARTSNLGSHCTLSESPSQKPLFKIRLLILSPLVLLFYFIFIHCTNQGMTYFCLLSLFSC